jgi:hypothetical protein
LVTLSNQGVIVWQEPQNSTVDARENAISVVTRDSRAGTTSTTKNRTILMRVVIA